MPAKVPVLSLWLCLVAACGDPVIERPTPEVPGAGPAAPGSAPGAPPRFGLPAPADGGAPDAAPGGVSAPVAGDQCAEEAKAASLMPVDLLLLMDASGSMTEKVPDRTRWELARDALSAFVKDPRSGGLGVGLQLFPVHTQTCNDDGTCFLPSPGGCRVFSACLAPGAAVGSGKACGAPGDAPCPAGTTCTPLGRCSLSGGDCTGMGQPCASGMGADVCGPRPRQCRLGPRSRGSCSAADYTNPAVPITELPAGAARLVGAMDTRLPIGATPLGEALQGTLTHLRARVAANPGRRAVLVIATDGEPGGCLLSSDVSPALQAASGAMPPITTYVVGVLDPSQEPTVRATIDRFAMAGGTGAPLIVSPNAQLTDSFLAALNQIRGAAVPCELAIPPPTGGAIDFGKVNVRINRSAGPSDLVYVASADRCAANPEGWYYDVDPTRATPTRVHLCPGICERLKADPRGSVEVRFGCRSRTID
jgi:hypothetical protein